MLRSLFATGLLVCLPALAHATQPITSDTGFYLGAAVGNTNLNLSSTAFGNAGSADETGFKVTGGWQFHPYLAAELSYYNPGEFKERDGNAAIRVTADIMEAGLVANAPIVAGLGAFGRIGIARWDGRIEATVDGDSGSLSETGTDYNWEVGLQYQFTPHFRLRSSFEQVEIDTNLGDDLPVTWRVRFYQLAAFYQF